MSLIARTIVNADLVIAARGGLTEASTSFAQVASAANEVGAGSAASLRAGLEELAKVREAALGVRMLSVPGYMDGFGAILRRQVDYAAETAGNLGVLMKEGTSFVDDASKFVPANAPEVRQVATVFGSHTQLAREWLDSLDEVVRQFNTQASFAGPL